MKQIITSICACLIILSPNWNIHATIPSVNKSNTSLVKADCVPATAQIDLNVNNVRARLLNGGDMWWDLDNGSYIVPAVPEGSNEPEVSSIFSGAVWIGGLDPAGNIKMAAVTYRQNGNTDYYSGPLDPETGLTDSEACENWDRFFNVYKTDIQVFYDLYEQAQNDPSVILTEEDIPDDVKYWPGKGNPYFSDKYNFELPSTGQGLASFWDEDFDGSYNPLNGDFPYLDHGCSQAQNRGEAFHLTPDQMIFWIYNDAGGAHHESFGSKAVQMEIQATAFAYATNDVLNNTSFYRHKMVNRAAEDIRDAYFALWVDYALGCPEDDLIGCDPERNLSFAYNLDAIDGDSGTHCSTVDATYGANIPMIGVDMLRGPIAPRTYIRDSAGDIIIDSITGEPLCEPSVPGGEIDFFKELGMSSFAYLSRPGANFDPTALPSNASEYYNFMRGFWRDGRPMTMGDCGYTEGNDTTSYLFPGLPNIEEEWSMCSSFCSSGYRSTLQSSGPFLLTPGAVNEFSYGVIWIPELEYPCPDITRFLAADDVVQNIFDHCFDIDLRSPDAPDVDVLALDEQIILTLSNDSPFSNNQNENYQEINPYIPNADDSYHFEGYKIYQLANNEVKPSQYEDPDFSRLVDIVDINNGIKEIVNWYPSDIPGQENPIWIPEIKAEGTDSGIRHSFSITKDLFAETEDQALVNGKEYYFSVIAYAYNEWNLFDPFILLPELSGQSKPYIESSRNVKVTTAIPVNMHPAATSSSYGDGIPIKRISGVGIGGHFVSLEDDEHEAILNESHSGKLKYKAGAGPIDVKIYNPLEVKDGTYRLRINASHNDASNVCAFEPGATWELTDDNGLMIESHKSIDQLNEQLIEGYGFSVTIGQTEDAGSTLTIENGVIGASIEYEDDDGTIWYSAVVDDGDNIPFIEENPFLRPTMNFLKTKETEVDNFLDPYQAYGEVGLGYFYPYYLASSVAPDPIQDVLPYYITPAWDSQGFIRSNNGLDKLNNVDIVMTSDKSKWSRCIVVETNNGFFRQNDLRPEGDNQTDMFDLRQSPSVDKEGNPDGEGIGLGWFPGYAIDVETGKRLNVFFGENSYFDEQFENLVVGDNLANGRDMLFNPSDEVFVVDTEGTQTWFASPQSLYAGGHHTIYVTRTEYDECASLKEQIGESTGNANLIGKINVLRSITWTSIPLVDSDAMLPYEDGYIPNDLKIQLRVDNPYNLEEEFNLQVATACSPIGDLPEYEFCIEGLQTVSTAEVDSHSNILEQVHVYPNPVSVSQIGSAAADHTITIASLPEDVRIQVYNFQGQLIKNFDHKTTQGDLRSVQWDLKTNGGALIGPGLFYIQLSIPKKNVVRTIKWVAI